MIRGAGGNNGLLGPHNYRLWQDELRFSGSSVADARGRAVLAEHERV